MPWLLGRVPVRCVRLRRPARAQRVRRRVPRDRRHVPRRATGSGALAATAVVLAAIYLLWAYQRVALRAGPRGAPRGCPDLIRPRGRGARAGPRAAARVRRLPEAAPDRDRPGRSEAVIAHVAPRPASTATGRRFGPLRDSIIAVPGGGCRDRPHAGPRRPRSCSSRSLPELDPASASRSLVLLLRGVRPTARTPRSTWRSRSRASLAARGDRRSRSGTGRGRRPCSATRSRPIGSRSSRGSCCSRSPRSACSLRHQYFARAGDEQPRRVLPAAAVRDAGMMLIAAANDLIVMFLALEILSLSLYVLTGLTAAAAQRTRPAMKYFLLGAFSSAFFLYGIAMAYGATGTTKIAGVAGPARRAHAGQQPLAAARASRCCWSASRSRSRRCRSTCGRPTCTRARRRRSPPSCRRRQGRRVRRADPGASTWRSSRSRATGARSSGSSRCVTIVVGRVLAIAQTDVKRMLAYSSIAHAGFILTGSDRRERTRDPRRDVLPGRVRGR